jgi:putative ABC transport system permease protein
MAQDIRYALRSFRQNPQSFLIAILTLALGIGANTAIFSFVDGTLLKPLVYPHAERILNIWEKPPDGLRNRTSSLTFLDWRKETGLFTELAAEVGTPLTLSGEGEPLVLHGDRVSANYFRIFGVQPAIGRTFASDEDTAGKEQVAVISHRLWQTHFGGNPNVLGHQITLGGRSFAVIGVMPAGTRFDRGSWADVWIPLVFQQSELSRDFHWLQVWALLRPGVNLEHCREQMKALAHHMSAAYPLSNRGWGITIDRYQDVVVDPQLRTSLYMLLAAVAALLVISCVNLANLLSVRGADREQEFAVRRALGAESSRLMRQLLTESLMLTSIGAGLGILLAFALLHAFRQLLPQGLLPADANIALDHRSLSFTVGITVLTAILSGLYPALRAIQIGPAHSLRERSRSSTHSRHALNIKNLFVVTEVALSFMLLTGAGLLARSFYILQNADTGFDGRYVVAAWTPVESSIKSNQTALTLYHHRLLETVKAVPGVQNAALTSALPFDGITMGTPFQVEGSPIVEVAKRPVSFFKIISPDYFRTMHIRLLKGRFLTRHDTAASAAVAVINQSVARQYFPGRDPIGKRLVFPNIDLVGNQLGKDVSWEVVGVVADEKIVDLRDFWTCIYVANPQIESPVLALVLRTAIDPGVQIKSVQQAVWKLNPNQPLDRIRTIAEIQDESLGPDRLRTFLLFLFSALATVLSAIGIYGVIAYVVVQRTREMGLRAALGASPIDVLALILRNTLALASIGLGCGLVGAFLLTRFLSSLLFQIPSRDPLSFAVAAVLVMAVTLLAGLIPAIRAATLSPVTALKSE